tara:strand:+ start:272 stop:484 length:213 start_codon:yes stop_codon:yes gene_type:complete
MKFMLVMALCSQLHNSCMTPVADDTRYIDFKSCLIEGYEQSAIVLKTLPAESVNSKQLYVKFQCKPQTNI